MPPHFPARFQLWYLPVSHEKYYAGCTQSINQKRSNL